MKQFFCALMLAFLSWNASAGILAQFRTTVGDLDVELYEKDKPVTVQNFIHYVSSGAYSNTFFHRCIPNFIVQGGGFSVINRAATNLFWPDGVFFVQNFGKITNEFNVGPRLTNSFGTIAMAKLGGDPNSASSDWFFNLANNSANLDFQNGGFTVFGRVVRGTNVLNVFNTYNKTTTIPHYVVDLTWWWGAGSGFGQTFSDLPVNYAAPTYPAYTNLVYVYDISFLDVQVQPLTNHAHQISWNSVTNATNYVEFTTNLPPVWHSLWTTNGNGAALKVIDTVTNAPRRFYRVRVNY